MKQEWFEMHAVRVDYAQMNMKPCTCLRIDSV